MRALAIAGAALVAAGCHNYTTIRADELPKLNGPTGGVTTDGQVIAVASNTVETPDGRVVQINGDFDVVLTTRDGRVELDGPIQASVEDYTLTIKSADHAPVAVPLTATEKVEIKQLSLFKNFAWACGAIVVLAIALTATE